MKQINDFIAVVSQQLMGALPGASELMTTSAGQPATATAGVLGGALGGMTSRLGGAGGALALVAMIQQTGFSPAKIAGLVQKFMELVRGNAGDGLTRKLFAQLPELASLAA